MEKISIARALIELKTLDKRIQKTMKNLQPVTMLTGKKHEAGITSRDDFEKSVQSSYQSLMALVDRKRKIKSAIVKSNALTEVMVANEKMTVADAKRDETFDIIRDLSWAFTVAWPLLTLMAWNLSYFIL